ncbi:phenylacetyl-CoA ligase [Roridomyces roridus]|uniref:Phenylacetyl-CoA ligase n=1 Tax=Roridomyces roridus TaxID=1738132 RepID=A0AAD7BHF8_9AGAR|nr:phenylacetyl-CoA ligase [Roridomyces roridus]
MPYSLVPPPDNLSVAQFLLDGLDNHVTRAQRSASTPCLIDDDSGQRVYLEELRTRTGKIATAMNFYWKLDSCISPPGPDYGPCAWATHRLGGIVATLGPMLTADEITHQLRIARPSIIFVHSECLASVLPAAGLVGLHPSRIILIDGIGSSSPGPHGLKNLDALIQEADSLPRFNERILAAGEAKNTIAFLAPSSGTTGTQKAVMISHYNVISIVIQMATSSRLNEPYAPLEERRFRPGDICYGLHIISLSLTAIDSSQLTLVLTPKFNFEKFLASIEKYRITHLTLEPIVKNYDLSSIRMCLVAAAPLSASLTQELLQILPNIHLGQGYGLTETCGATSIASSTYSQKIGTLGSVGQLLPGTLAKVVKPDGTLANETETGELYIKGGQVALGYYGNEEATRETFINGWLKTGDQVYFKDGDIFVVERLKELIKVKGFQVPPAELEGHLLTHPKIADAAVIGVPDDYSGELPMAFIVLKPEVAAALKDERLEKQLREDIFKHVASAKSKHKWLTGGIQFISAIPRNPSGKILRRLLRNQTSQDTKSIHARL